MRESPIVKNCAGGGARGTRAGAGLHMVEQPLRENIRRGVVTCGTLEQVAADG
jgi:hypothetical protein